VQDPLDEPPLLDEPPVGAGAGVGAATGAGFGLLFPPDEEPPPAPLLQRPLLQVVYPEGHAEHAAPGVKKSWLLKLPPGA